MAVLWGQTAVLSWSAGDAELCLRRLALVSQFGTRLNGFHRW